VNRYSSFLLLGSLIAGGVVLGVSLLKHGHAERPKVGARGATAAAPSSSAVGEIVSIRMACRIKSLFGEKEK
jgi:hypothetical protein